MVCEEIEAKVRDFYKTDGAEEETEEEKTEAPAAKSIKTVVDEKAAEAAKKAEE